MALWKPSRRLFLAGAGLIAAPAIVRAQSPQIRRLLLNQMPVAVGGGGTGSAWGDHGTNVALSTTSVTNDTAAGLANSFSSVRGTQAYTSQKRYFEVKVLSAPATFNILIIGLMDNATANGAAMDGAPLANSMGNTIFNGTVQANGWTGTALGSAVTLANNDLLGLALDGVNSFYYLSKNGTYFLSGDPTSGASGTGAVGNGSGGFPGARPYLAVFGATDGVYQLLTGSNINPVHIPSGYLAWG